MAAKPWTWPKKKVVPASPAPPTKRRPGRPSRADLDARALAAKAAPAVAAKKAAPAVAAKKAAPPPAKRTTIMATEPVKPAPDPIPVVVVPAAAIPAAPAQVFVPAKRAVLDDPDEIRAGIPSLERVAAYRDPAVVVAKAELARAVEKAESIRPIVYPTDEPAKEAVPVDDHPAVAALKESQSGNPVSNVTLTDADMAAWKDGKAKRDAAKANFEKAEADRRVKEKEASAKAAADRAAEAKKQKV